MRITALVLFSVCLLSCTGFDFNKAKEVSQKTIDLLKVRDYSAMEELYSYDFKNSETPEQRVKKFNMVMDVVGEIKSVEPVEGNNGKDSQSNEFRYRLVCSNINVVVSVIVIEDFGDYLVSSVNIQQE